MKEITAIIRIQMMSRTKQALVDAGISSMTAREVLGRGSSRQKESLLKGDEAMQTQNQRLIAKRLLFVVVPDELVARTVKTIIRVNQTGSSGDGKIWVMPVMDAIRVRTGENSDMALDEV